MTNYSGHLRYLALASIWQFSYSFLGCIREHKYLKPKLEAVILDYIFLQSNIRLEHWLEQKVEEAEMCFWLPFHAGCPYSFWWLFLLEEIWLVSQ